MAVAEAGQISAAARSLHLAQPALTQSMRNLERAVGIPLLARHARGVTLTPAGQRLLEGARATLAAYDRALAEARDAAPRLRTLTVGAVSVTPGLGEILSEFRVAHPDFVVRWVPMTFDRDGYAVAEGEVDVAIVLPDYGGTGVRTALVRELPVFGCVAVGHPLAALDSFRLEDIADETFPGQHPTVSNQFADLFYLTAERGFRPRTTVHAPLTPDATWSLVASGRAITTTPEGAWRHSQEPIAARPVVDVPAFALRIMWRDENNPTVDAFVSFVRIHAGGDPADDPGARAGAPLPVVHPVSASRGVGDA